MSEAVITDPWALLQHYILQEGFVFTSITEPANVFDAIVIRNPSNCDCWTPKLGRSSRSLDEHIRFINQHGIRKALLIAESIDFLPQCPSLQALMIVPADSAAPHFNYQPLYQTNCVYLDCKTAYGGSTEPLHTELDYSKMPKVEELRLAGTGHNNYEQLRQLKSVHLSNDPKLKAVPAFQATQTLESIVFVQCPLFSLTGMEYFSSLSKVRLCYLRSLADAQSLAAVSDTLRELTIENCPKLRDFSFLFQLTQLRALNLIGNNKLPNLSFLSQMPKLESFRFSMEIEDGNLSLCQQIKNVRCLRRRKHYTAL